MKKRYFSMGSNSRQKYCSHGYKKKQAWNQHLITHFFQISMNQNTHTFKMILHKTEILMQKYLTWTQNHVFLGYISQVFFVIYMYYFSICGYSENFALIFQFGTIYFYFCFKILVWLIFFKHDCDTFGRNLIPYLQGHFFINHHNALLYVHKRALCINISAICFHCALQLGKYLTL